MLTIVLPEGSFFDENNSKFIIIKEQTIQLEHSLISISKWEQKWEKPFISKEQKTTAEFMDYVKCMTINSNVPELAYESLNYNLMNKIDAYIGSASSAYVSSNNDNKKSNMSITSEVIYALMIDLGIPFECQKWHLNRLLNLIDCCRQRHEPKKKLTKKELLERNRKLNEERKAKLNSRG